MPFSIASSNARVLLVCSCLALAACKPAVSDDPARVSSAATAATAASATPAAAAAGNRLPQYQSTVLALLAGNYAGQCHSVDGPATDGATEITASGQVASDKLRADLVAEHAMLTLGRVLDKGAPRSYFQSGGTPANWSLLINSDKGGDTLFSSGVVGYQCRQVARAAALAGKPLYPSVAAFFKGSTAAMACAEQQRVQVGRIDIDDQGVRVGSLPFVFAAPLAKETMTIEPAAGTLQYSAVYSDGASLVLTVDAAGKLVAAMGSRPGGVHATCAPPGEQ